MQPWTDSVLARIRDEIGTATPPSDGEIEDHYAELGHWILVALRILKRRRAAIAAGGSGAVKSLTLPGVLGVSLDTGNLPGLDSQIARLEALYAAETSPGGPLRGRYLTRNGPRE